MPCGEGEFWNPKCCTCECLPEICEGPKILWDQDYCECTCPLEIQYDCALLRMGVSEDCTACDSNVEISQRMRDRGFYQCNPTLSSYDVINC